MLSVEKAYDELIKTGYWRGPTDLIKENCQACYNKRNIGMYTKDGTYEPCKCIKKKLHAMLEAEKKQVIKVIGADNLKGLEDEDSSGSDS